MQEHTFDLIFSLPASAPDPEAHLGALQAAGCDDAVVGVGQHGGIALAFAREAESASAAIESATGDVLRAIPDACLVRVRLSQPDL
jgi:hypothetical protein